LRRSEIRYVSVDKEFARVEAHNLVGRHSAVGAADPQILRRLLAFEPSEKVGVGRNHPFHPGAIVCFQVIQHRCA